MRGASAGAVCGDWHLSSATVAFRAPHEDGRTFEAEQAIIVLEMEQERTRIVAKIESLHGTTPAEIFQSGLENLTEIEAVTAAVLWKNGSVTAGWSNTDAARIALMVLALDEEQRRHLRD